MKEQQLKALGHQGPVCYNNQCPRREQCLRWLANGHANEKPLVLSVVNIQNAEVNSGNCPLFAADKTVTVWRGMTRFYHDMPHHTELAIKEHLIRNLTRTRYYKLRKGELPINATLRADIERVCRQHGWTEPLVFDSTGEEYLW